jgi:hypothetical protein
LTASVSPSAATGTVTFYDGTTSLGSGTLSSGTATLSTTFSTTGTHSLTAIYGGDLNYATSSSAAEIITVSAASNSATSSSSADCGNQDSTDSVYTTAADAFTSGTNTVTSPSITVSNANESAICAQNSGTTVTVTNPTIVSSSAGTNANDSSVYGTDAAILAYGSSTTSATGGSINVTDGSISTTGLYGNGVFASGDGATVTLNGTTITTTGSNAHGVGATEGGTLNLTNVTATTSGASSPVVASGQGGGTVWVSGGTYTAGGYQSAGLYLTGTSEITGGTFTASNAEAAVVDGSDSPAVLTGAALSGTGGDDRGVLLYSSSASTSGVSSFTMSGGSITYNCPVTSTGTTCANGSTSRGQNNPATLFSVANATSTISLTDVKVTNNTSTTTNSYGTLLTAQALNSGTWGTAGSNGGNVTFTAMGTAVTGNVIVDNISTATIQIYKDSSQAGSTLTGAINSANTGKTVSLVLDSASKWAVTGTSYLTTLAGLTLNGTTVSNIDGGGHCVYYSGSINGSTSTTTYTLSGNSGGYLAPKGTTGLTCD